MAKPLTMVYWKSEKFWLGKLIEHPTIMTQGETLEELEEQDLSLPRGTLTRALASRAQR